MKDWELLQEYARTGSEEAFAAIVSRYSALVYSACLREFHDLGAQVVIFTRSGGLVTVSDGQGVTRVGPLPLVEVDNVTGGRDAFWAALLVAHLDGKPWPLCVRFAHEVAALKLGVVGHVERMIDREPIYRRLADRVE